MSLVCFFVKEIFNLRFFLKVFGFDKILVLPFNRAESSAYFLENFFLVKVARHYNRHIFRQDSFPPHSLWCLPFYWRHRFCFRRYPSRRAGHKKNNVLQIFLSFQALVVITHIYFLKNNISFFFCFFFFLNNGSSRMSEMTSGDIKIFGGRLNPETGRFF